MHTVLAAGLLMLLCLSCYTPNSTSDNNTCAQCIRTMCSPHCKRNHQWRIQGGGGGGGGSGGRNPPPPSGPSMNIIIMPRVYEYHYCTPRVLLSAAMKRSTSILAYFPTSSTRARGAVRLHDCKWCIMLLLSRSPNGCALVR